MTQNCRFMSKSRDFTKVNCNVEFKSFNFVRVGIFEQKLKSYGSMKNPDFTTKLACKTRLQNLSFIFQSNYDVKNE